MKNAKFHSGDIKKCCENKLELDFRSGKELNASLNYKGNYLRVTVPKGKKKVHPKTYKSMAKGLLLDVHQFDELLECSLSGDDYFKLLDDLP